jgi:hypothetical protein
MQLTLLLVANNILIYMLIIRHLFPVLVILFKLYAAFQPQVNRMIKEKNNRKKFK